MSGIITKKNWIYWLLLALVFALLVLFFKSKARTTDLDRRLDGVTVLLIATDHPLQNI